MRTARIVALVLCSALTVGSISAQTVAHETTPAPGSHPRLILTASEVAAARAKVNAPNSPRSPARST